MTKCSENDLQSYRVVLTKFSKRFNSVILLLLVIIYYLLFIIDVVDINITIIYDEAYPKIIYSYK